MVKIEAVIHPSMIDGVKVALDQIGIRNILLTEAYVHSDVPSARGCYRGCPIVVDVPRWKLEVIISSLQVDEVVDTIVHHAATESAEDFDTLCITELADAIRIKGRKRIGLAWS